MAEAKSPIAFERTVARPRKCPRWLAGFLPALAVLAVAFSVPLYHLLQLAAADQLYSDIPLIPFVSLYIVWLRRNRLPRSRKPAPGPAVLFFGLGFLALAVVWFVSRGRPMAVENNLALTISALLLFFDGLCFLFLGAGFMRTFAFPVALLFFVVPFPVVLRDAVAAFLQHGSAACAGLFFQLSGTPVMQDGLDFHLPGCVIHVAPECSGIHSTLVLAIVSLVGGWLFLRTPWKRAVLVLAVLPLALARNGFRIFVIGRLCAAYGPRMLDSPIHHHGGPIFFVLSLIPFLLLLFVLRKTERTNLETSTEKLL